MLNLMKRVFPRAGSSAEMAGKPQGISPLRPEKLLKTRALLREVRLIPPAYWQV